MKKILVAGATGYLGRYVVREFKRRGYWVRVLARSAKSLYQEGPFASPAIAEFADDVFIGQLTRPETLAGLMDGIDIVFSSVGKSRQKDLLSFEQVDYQCNKNLIDLALQSEVEKFIYVSLANPDEIMHLEIVRCHERVVDELKASGMPHTVVRPSGYFSDMGVLLDMARRGRAWLVGEGENRFNPIHGADLAVVCVDAAEQDIVCIEAGGPDVFTQREAAELAFEILGKEPKISTLSIGVLSRFVWLLKKINKQFGDLLDFIVTAGEVDGVVEKRGSISLRRYFESLVGE